MAQNLGVVEISDSAQVNGGRQQGVWQCDIVFGTNRDWLLARLMNYDVMVVGYTPAPTTRENPVIIE